MDDVRSIVNTITRVTFILMSLTLLAWAFEPGYRVVCNGFLLGAVIGLINVRYLAVKVERISEVVGNPERRRFSLGFVTRLCLGLLGIMFAVRFDAISLETTVIGIFLIPVMLVPVAIVHSLKKR